MGDGDGARGVHRRAAAPEDEMTRLGLLTLRVAVAAADAGWRPAPPWRRRPPPQPLGAASAPVPRPRRRARPPPPAAARLPPRPGQVESDPIRCWWKTDRTSVRVGETFGLTLTCGVIETGPIAVVPALTQLEGGAIQLTPFEVVSATRRADVVVPPWRYVQFEYTVRLLNDGYFGQDVSLPALTVTYNLKSAGADSAGRDQSYVLPALPMRILSLVPRAAERHPRRLVAHLRRDRVAALLRHRGAGGGGDRAGVRRRVRGARGPALRAALPGADARVRAPGAGGVAARRLRRGAARACRRTRAPSGWSPELARRALPAHPHCRRLGARSPHRAAARRRATWRRARGRWWCAPAGCGFGRADALGVHDADRRSRARSTGRRWARASAPR